MGSICPGQYIRPPIQESLKKRFTARLIFFGQVFKNRTMYPDATKKKKGKRVSRLKLRRKRKQKSYSKDGASLCAIETTSKPRGENENQSIKDRAVSHIIKSGKPFSLPSLASELGVQEVHLHSAIKHLMDIKILVRKEFTTGVKVKTEIYYINQDKLPRKKKLEELRCLEEDLMKELAAVNSELSNDELNKRIEEEEQNRNDLISKLKCAREDHEGAIHAHQVKINDWVDMWKGRKEICDDFVYNLSDALEMKPKDVVKSVLKIQTDEDANERILPKYPMKGKKYNNKGK